MPNDGIFTISINSPANEVYSINIYNSLGIEIYRQENIDVLGKFDQLVDISSSAQGLYVVFLRDSKNQVDKKIIIRK